jgi:sulfite reductase beta subunit-like hemoprotein
MEPTSLDATTQLPQKKGRPGSLSNPEVIKDVPGHIIPIIEREFDDFDSAADKFLDGNTPEDEFIKFRLKQGVYGQRQADVQMIRIKLPMGGVTPEQMEMFADVVEEWVPLGKGHITTRQNIQLHHVPLKHAAALIRKASEAGLSSREGCGNTVRNVTGDPFAGVAPDELFDLTPYAAAYARYFVRHQTTQAMPRKIKTAFDGSPEDRSITGIHDIAFLARERDGVKGVEVRVGGGTSIMPRVAPTLYDFVELDNGDYLKVSEAVLRIFDRQDFLRVNRARARIKVLIDKIGMDAFREMVEEELKGDWVAERDFDPTPLMLIHDEEAHAPEPKLSYAQPNGDGSEFERFRASNVKPQRQEGFSTVQVRVVRGDLSPEQFRRLADLMRKYSGGAARMTIEQNMVLRWVRDESVYEVWQELNRLGLGGSGADEIVDTVSCPGTDSCKLGITSSMGLNNAIMERVESMNITDPLTKRIHIKNSGCPNGCGQHHIANIGFYGASIKVGDKTMPAYVAHLGGQYEGGEVVFGTRLKVRLPAKRIPDVIERWLGFYEKNRNDGEEFNAFVERIGVQEFEAIAKPMSLPVEFNLENLQEFVDWNRSVPYQVIRGEGECAV